MENNISIIIYFIGLIGSLSLMWFIFYIEVKHKIVKYYKYDNYSKFNNLKIKDIKIKNVRPDILEKAVKDEIEDSCIFLILLSIIPFINLALLFVIFFIFIDNFKFYLPDLPGKKHFDNFLIFIGKKIVGG